MNELIKIDCELNKPDITEARRNQLLLTCRKKMDVKLPFSRVECDRVKLSMCLIDDETLKPTLPISLYFALDCHSRYPLGVVLEMGHGENKENVVNLLRQIYMSDDNLNARGRPKILFMDNGAGFNNTVIPKLCQRLEVSLAYTPSNSPSAKPFIESFFNSLRHCFFSGMKVVTQNGEQTIGFNSYRSKRKANDTSVDLTKIADIKVSDFLRALNIYLTEYVNTVHSELKDTPQNVWNKGRSQQLDTSYFIKYEKVKQQFHCFRHKSSQKLQSNGVVRVHNQTFSSPQLKFLYNRLNTLENNGSSVDVVVYYDPFDASKVSVIPVDNKAISLKSLLA